MTKRFSVGLIYFIIILMTLLLRMSSALGIYDLLGVNGDIYFTCMVQLLIFGFLPIFLYWLIVARQERGFLSVKLDFGIRKVTLRNWFRILLIAICMIVTASFISFIWQNILNLMGYVRVPTKTDYSNIKKLFLELFLVAVLPGIFEEITHRGLLYAGYKECGWKYVLVSAILFSLMHQNIVQTGYTFYDGIIIALVMYYTGSIWGGIAMHFLNNAVSVIQGYCAQNNGIFSFVDALENWLYGTIGGYFVLMLIATCGAISMFFLFKKMREDAVRRKIVSIAPFDKVVGVLPLYKDAPFIATVILGVFATMFSFVWGILR